MKRFFLLGWLLLGLGLQWSAQAQTQPGLVADRTEQAVFAGVPQVTWAPDSETGFALFDKAFYANQVFLLGEAHGVARVQEVDFALFRHLNERAGVRRYLGEFDFVKAYYLNQYLQTGDEGMLQLVFRSWVREQAQWANEEFRTKLRKLRTWNLTLPAQRQFRFVGIDELQDLPLAADYLGLLRRRKMQLPGQLGSRLDSVQTLLRQPEPTGLAGLTRRTLQELEQREQAARLALGGGYAEVRQLLRNLGYRPAGLGREAILFANFEELLRTQPLKSEKLYGLWGLAHVLQSPIQGNTRLLAGLIRDSKLPGHDKVVSVLAMFSGCRMLYRTSELPPAWQEVGQPYSRTDKFNHDGPLTMLTGMEELKQRSAPGSTTLFRLDAPGAATTRQPIQVRYAPGIPAGQQIQFSPQLPASAYVQYLLLVRDSGPVTPLAQP